MIARPTSEDREAALSLTPVSRETLERLDRYVDLLLAFQAHTNLIAPSTIPNLWTRHIADSLQLLEHAPNARIWADLGAGGGFPSLVLACALADIPGVRLHLVESIGKKANFLREVGEKLNLPVDIHPVRIEDFVKNPPSGIDVVTARALAPLHRLLRLAEPLLTRGAMGLFLKGQDVAVELTEASSSWMIEASLLPSKTHPSAQIVAVRRAVRKGRG